jgi:hypothetical protein
MEREAARSVAEMKDAAETEGARRATAGRREERDRPALRPRPRQVPELHQVAVRSYVPCVPSGGSLGMISRLAQWVFHQSQ